jgi:hypothetical protein
LTELLKQQADTLQGLAKSLPRETSLPPTDGFHQLLQQQHDALRQLLAEWNTEGEHRRRANEELRPLMREDIRGQADRFRQLLEAAPTPAPTPTTGTITASSANAPGEAPDDQVWRDEVRAELRRIVDRLERMSERMEEIFQI